MGNRQDNVRITATVDGQVLGVFEDRSGGASDSTTVSYPTGGMGPRLALGGRQEVTPVLIKKLFDAAAQQKIKWLRGRTGKGTMVVTEQPLDDEGNATGDPEVFTGKLKQVHLADRQADSAAAETMELEMIVEGPVG